ncbi:HAD family hydrolase [Salipiger sp.]|uniref:HAD family hydrolase n=1 Tax=Salipiger sp. TaxID=2078585 RepID=UPI003A97BFC9
MTGAPIAAVLFDKDGTLFDFGATWNVWALGALHHFAAGDAARLEALAAEARFDLAIPAFHPDSPIIAGTNREAAECLARALPGHAVEDIEEHLMRSAATAPLTEAVPLGPLLAELRAMGMRLGVMTNDTEFSARAHLGAVGVSEAFDFIAGFDSGHGAKPAPGPLLAFADSIDLPPGQVVMVGDSTHDLEAGRAAGMRTVGVLTGPAVAGDLAHLADVVLPDIGHLPGWLAAEAR